MNVFIFGATGFIGSSVVSAVRAAGHNVTALTRTTDSANTMRARGVETFVGDLKQPRLWLNQIKEADAVIQCAATWDDDMADTDWSITDLIIQNAKHRLNPLRVIYTGGCWLYGNTGDSIATDTSHRPGFGPFNWMLRSATGLMNAPMVSAAIIHPAMVYRGPHGVFSRFHAAAQCGNPIEIWGSSTTRWPLIHADDLGRAYALLVNQHDSTGHFNASTQCGVTVRKIADHIAAQYQSNIPHRTVPYLSVLKEHGPWAGGPMLDQQMDAPRLREMGWLTEYNFPDNT